MSEQPEQVAPTMTDAEVAAAQLPSQAPVTVAEHVCQSGYCHVCGATNADVTA